MPEHARSIVEFFAVNWREAKGPPERLVLIVIGILWFIAMSVIVCAVVVLWAQLLPVVRVWLLQ